MQVMPQELKTSGPRSSALSEIEVEAIEMFINFLKLIGLPKSIGEIYGLLFVAPRPLAAEEIIQRLGISTGAASQGLKLLRGLGAVKAVYSPGDRRDHFVADLELSKFATVFIDDELKPRMERAMERIQRMEALLPGLEASDREATEARVARLRHWLDKGQKILPLISHFLLR
jgi:HTH-type transcriptional regulator, glycine betaine synthesis regulator